MSPAWRWQRCPVCRNVERSSDYAVLSSYTRGWDEGQARRQCPSCGFIGQTFEFPIVRERHAAEKVGRW
jgi:hypothetical protein